MADEELAKTVAGCADCGARRPRFASITLGIWLCNRCYALHRNVGAHITRTKCVGLDKWSPQELHRMKSIGNERAAVYWERDVPPQYRRPTANSTNEAVDEWIRDKYERKLFCPRGRDPPSVPEYEVKTTVKSSPSSDASRRLPMPAASLTPTLPGPSSGVGIPQSNVDNVGDEEFGSFVQAP